MPGEVSGQDPLQNLREYRHLAPWNLRDLASLAAAILDAAAALPSERTIRFYVAKDLVASPEGRGTAATYSYRHLLQVLAIKLRQMEGANLGTLADEMATTTGDVLERRVAHALGPSLPAPSVLPLFGDDTRPRGRAGQAFRVPSEPATTQQSATTSWHRLPIAHGIELHVRDDHPIALNRTLTHQLTEAVALAMRRLSPSPTPTDTSTDSLNAASPPPHPTREKPT